MEHFSTSHYVSLHRNELSGTVGTEIGMLTSLSDRVYMHTNRLSGVLPTELGELTQVSLPALHENSLSGTIPTQLARVTGLQFPSISYNRLSGTTPSQLGDWTSLQARLDIASNNWHINPKTGRLGEGMSDLGEQARIDAGIIQREHTPEVYGTAYGSQTKWYASWGQCGVGRQNPQDKARCSMTAYPDVWQCVGPSSPLTAQLQGRPNGGCTLPS
jgi:hypothetical protein